MLVEKDVVSRSPSQEAVATSRPSKTPAPQPAQETQANAKSHADDAEGRNGVVEVPAAVHEGPDSDEALRPVEVGSYSLATLRTAADIAQTLQG